MTYSPKSVTIDVTKTKGDIFMEERTEDLVERLAHESLNLRRRYIIEKIVASYLSNNEYDEAKIKKRIDDIYYGALQFKAMQESNGIEEYKAKLEELLENYKNIANEFNAIIEEVLAEYK